MLIFFGDQRFGEFSTHGRKVLSLMLIIIEQEHIHQDKLLCFLHNLHHALENLLFVLHLSVEEG